MLMRLPGFLAKISLAIGLCVGIVVFCQEMSKESKQQELVALFLDCVRDGRLQALLDSHGTFNVKARTLGGKVCWETIEESGWKLQFNKLSGWWRILNSKGMRVARGTTLEQLRSLLEGRSVSVVTNYFDEGYRFDKTAAKVPSGRSVILIHGWGVRARSMQKLADAFAAEGFDAYNYDYPSAEAPIPEQVARFLACYRELLAQLPENEEIFFLTHSMGGLLLRGALAQMEIGEAQRIRAIVMLGPPNRGSGLAYFGKLPGVSKVNASLKDMTPEEDSYVMNIPPPVWLPPVGIIAGKYDGKVSLDSTRLPEPLEYEQVVVNSTHPGLRDPENVLAEVLRLYQDLAVQGK